MRRTAYAVAVLFAFAVPQGAGAHYLPKPKHPTPEQRVAYLERSVQHDRTALAWIGRVVHAERSLAATLIPERNFHRVALRWHLRALARARRKLVVYTGDFTEAAAIVGRYYGASVERWLLSCASSEGGNGRFVWNSKGSGAGGWMQFMSGTFRSNVGWAWADARSRGLHASLRARSYTEPLGQAIVAGAMYAHHGNSGQWTGARC